MSGSPAHRDLCLDHPHRHLCLDHPLTGAYVWIIRIWVTHLPAPMSGSSAHLGHPLTGAYVWITHLPAPMSGSPTYRRLCLDHALTGAYVWKEAANRLSHRLSGSPSYRGNCYNRLSDPVIPPTLRIATGHHYHCLSYPNYLHPIPEEIG
jgi:hypothetical protein